MKKLLFLLVFICVALVGNAQRRHYSGSHHTTSHGGHYAGGQGSHHKGGHYRNARSSNRYGIHKTSGRRRR